MKFTIGQAAKRMQVTVPTLRYYDKEGLLPFVEKKSNGIRIFKEADFEWLNVITCMKNTGMPIKDIRRYIDLCMRGDSTLTERLEIFQRRKEAVLTQIEELNHLMKTVEHKIRYYEQAIEAGTEAIHKEKSIYCKEEQ